jgi:hypothetical protein
MRRLARAITMALTTIVVAACSDRPVAPLKVPQGKGAASIAPDGPVTDTEFVLTPNGYYYRSCVYEVPPGAVLRGSTLHLGDGTTRQVPECIHPGPVGRRPTNAMGGPPPGQLNPPATHGWTVWGTTNTPSGRTIRHVSARWVVPQVPAAYAPGMINYLFPGAENTNTIVQPVLQYGANGVFGGAYWVIAPWMCGPTCIHGLSQNVSVGDVLGGTIDANNCSGGFCDWSIAVYDSTNSTSTTLTEPAGAVGNGETADNYTNAVSGALEIYNLSNCTNLSGGQHLFSQVSFLDNLGSSFVSGWTPDRDTGVQPSACGYGGLTTGASNMTLVDSLAPVLTVHIDGPDGVVSGNTGTWTANLGLPGTGPYTYSWSGLLSGSSSSVSGSPTSSGYLNVRVIDAAADTANASLFVTVCPSGQIICP